MKRILMGVLVLLFGMNVQAGLVGDTVHIAHNYPTIGSEIYSPMDVLVQNGTGDLANVSPWYTVDVDDLSVYVDFVGSTVWTTSAFNGLIISQIDSALSNFVVTTNMAGWGDSRFTTSTDSLLFNWNGLDFTADTFFQVNFNGNGGGEVPEPITIALLGLGLAGMSFARKNRA